VGCGKFSWHWAGTLSLLILTSSMDFIDSFKIIRDFIFPTEKCAESKFLCNPERIQGINLRRRKV